MGVFLLLSYLVVTYGEYTLFIFPSSFYTQYFTLPNCLINNRNERVSLPQKGNLDEKDEK